jgi:hypothetical protein
MTSKMIKKKTKIRAFQRTLLFSLELLALELFIVSKKNQRMQENRFKGKGNRYALGPLNLQFLFGIIPYLSFLKLFGIEIIGNGREDIGEVKGPRAVS